MGVWERVATCKTILTVITAQRGSEGGERVGRVAVGEYARSS